MQNTALYKTQHYTKHSTIQNTALCIATDWTLYTNICMTKQYYHYTHTLETSQIRQNSQQPTHSLPKNTTPRQKKKTTNTPHTKTSHLQTSSNTLKTHT